MSTADAPDDLRSAYRVWHREPVRWADMDSYGHVNNAKYFTYCESARMRWFEEVKLFADVADPSSDGHDGPPPVGPALAHAECSFLRQTRHPAVLEIGVRATKVGRSSFTLEYVLVPRVEGEPAGALDEVLVSDPVARGTSVVVWVDYEKGASAPLPEPLKQRIRDLDGVTSTAS